jgi:hypothetical protein
VYWEIKLSDKFLRKQKHIENKGLPKRLERWWEQTLSSRSGAEILEQKPQASLQGIVTTIIHLHLQNFFITNWNSVLIE